MLRSVEPDSWAEFESVGISTCETVRAWMKEKCLLGVVRSSNSSKIRQRGLFSPSVKSEGRSLKAFTSHSSQWFLWGRAFVVIFVLFAILIALALLLSGRRNTFSTSTSASFFVPLPSSTSFASASTHFGTSASASILLLFSSLLLNLLFRWLLSLLWRYLKELLWAPPSKCFLFRLGCRSLSRTRSLIRSIRLWFFWLLVLQLFRSRNCSCRGSCRIGSCCSCRRSPVRPTESGRSSGDSCAGILSTWNGGRTGSVVIDICGPRAGGKKRFGLGEHYLTVVMYSEQYPRRKDTGTKVNTDIEGGSQDSDVHWCWLKKIGDSECSACGVICYAQLLSLCHQRRGQTCICHRSDNLAACWSPYRAFGTFNYSRSLQ